MRRARAILGVMAKEFCHMRHDPLTLGLVIGVPLLQLLIFGFALSLRVHHLPTAVLNFDRHAASRELVTSLSHSAAFDIARVVSTETELRDLMRRGAVSAGVLIPEDYSANELYRRPSTLKVWIDTSDGVTVSQVTIAAWAASLRESEQRLLAAEGSVSPRAPVLLEIQLFGRAFRSADVFVPALTGILVHMITLLITTLAIVSEKERGTWEQILVTPLGPAGALAGKLLACASIGFAEACCLLLLMRYGFGIPIQGSLPLLALAVVMILIPSLALALLSSAHAGNQARAMQFTYLLFMPSVLLSGFLFPRSAMPTPIYYGSSVLPATAIVRILRGVIMRGAGLADVLPDFGLLLLVSMGVFAIFLVTSNRSR